MIEPGELPEEGARRELLEESGLEIDGELEIVGCFPMRVYGYDTLQISYRGRVVEGEAIISHEHDGARWGEGVGHARVAHRRRGGADLGRP